MVSLTRILIFTLFLSSCAKVEYLWDQGRGQMKILTKSKPNDELLKDVTVEPEHKKKIKLIKEYKQYFYQFWDKEPSDIYNKTYILDQKAVTYLVTASPFNKIEARKECFIFMGCFPYLGFFSEEKAIEFAKDLEREEWVTYIRPVYAYSSLGYFSDPILSSFFYYSDRQLADLIFHELFHTIFFAKDEVNFNENLANYFAKEMVKVYFKDDKIKLQELEKKYLSQKMVNKKIVYLVKELNTEYEKNNFKDKEKADSFFRYFIKERFQPTLENYCRENKIQNCFGLKRQWNNASFVAFLTYEEQASKLKKLHIESNKNLKEFFDFIVKKYESYEDSDFDSFEKYLFNPGRK